MGLRINSRALVLFGVLFGCFIAAPSHAGTLCEKGRIRSMSIDYEKSQFDVSTGLSSTAEHDKVAILKLFGTRILQASSYERWQEKYSMVKAAYATDSYVFIWSNDSDCYGNQDEFEIIACQAESDCQS